MTVTFDCCDHCEHDINDPEIGAHHVPCPEGCNDEWDDPESNAYQARVEAGLEQEDSSDGK